MFNPRSSRRHIILADQSEAETHAAISRIVGGTYTKSVPPIKNAVFVDDNFSPLVDAIKMCRCGVWSTWWNIGSNGFLANFSLFALSVKWRPTFYVPPNARPAEA